MEFYHLRSFVVVAETKNLTQAAKRLCSTPPAISAHIKGLEQELGTDLFTRSTKGMALTSKGELLLAKAQKTLDSAVDMVNLAADNQDELIGDFKLGLNQSVELLQITNLLNNLEENCPGISLSIEQSASGRILEQIDSSEIDGGFIYGEVPNHCDQILIRQEKITTIAPTSFEVSELQTKRHLAEGQWITMNGYCPFDKYLINKLGSSVNRKVQSNCERSRLELVKSGIGLSFIELSTALNQEKKGNVIVISDLDFEVPLSFVYSSKRANEPIVKALCQEVRVLWNITL